MMAINFPAAAFLAGLKVPSQIMYCISQDNTGAPVVVYKDSQNVQQPPWNNQDYTNQPKEIQQVNIATNTENQQQSSIRVEAGNQVSFKFQNIDLFTNLNNLIFRSQQFKFHKILFHLNLPFIQHNQVLITNPRHKLSKHQITFMFLVKFTLFLISHNRRSKLSLHQFKLIRKTIITVRTTAILKTAKLSVVLSAKKHFDSNQR
jgi:hypothetical protein